MKRLFTVLTMLIAFCFVAPAYAEFKDMWATVYVWDGEEGYHGEKVLTRKITNVTFQVLQADSDTLETLYVYNDRTFTSLTNPVTTTNYASNTVCNDMVRFKVDPGEINDIAVDLIVTDVDGGYTAFVEGFDENSHTIVIDERPNIQHHGMIWYGSAVSGTEVDTGIDFDYDTLLTHVAIEAVTVDSGVTINVGLLSSGTNGDADGFILGTSVATAGYPLITLATSGALMDDATNFDPDGHYVISANEQSLTYTLPAGADTAVGYIHYFFTRTR